ncbi:integumentary mucin B.1 [Pelodiscus sinensis]|uniref:integumentary mucin B.1 n=1 Tax=Pelodiscus sinensis TaxID=13735 RepID=UPI003F6BE0C4
MFAAGCLCAWLFWFSICCPLLQSNGVDASGVEPPCIKEHKKTADMKDCCCFRSCEKTCKPVPTVIEYTHKRCSTSVNASKCSDHCSKKENFDYKERQCCCCQEDEIEYQSGILICNKKTIDFKYKNVLSCACKDCAKP